MLETDLCTIIKNTWEPLSGFSKTYDIRCLDDYTCEIRNRKNRTKVKGSKNNTGYVHVNNLIADDGTKSKMVFHRLIMHHYFPQEDEKNMQVDHVNHNRSDNRLCNLIWVSGRENMRNLNTTNRYEMEYVDTLPEDVIDVSEDLRTSLKMFFSPSTVHFYEQSTQGRYNVRKWSSNGYVTYTTNSGSRCKIGITTVRKYIPNLKQLPVDFESVKKDSDRKDHFYCQFENIDQSKYFWEPLRFFENKYEVADIDGYGVIRNKRTKKIICGQIHKITHEIKLRHEDINRECNYKYVRILKMHYFPNDNCESFEDYLKTGKYDTTSNFTKIIDLVKDSTKSPVKMILDKCDKLPNTCVPLETYNGFYFNNVYFCKQTYNIYKQDDFNVLMIKWYDDSFVYIKDIHGIARRIDKLSLVYEYTK